MKVIYSNTLEVNNETQYAQDGHILDCRGCGGYRRYPLCIEFHQTVAFLLELSPFWFLRQATF